MHFKKYILCASLFGALLGLSACEDFLDREPLDKVTPNQFFNTDQHLADYAIARYNFSTKGGWGVGPIDDDTDTDDMVARTANFNQWVPERRLTSQGGSISFSTIRDANYFFEQVLPKYEAGTITGSEIRIKHFIGEMYFMRAWSYFEKLRSYGDFPILTKVLPDQESVLVANSKREPRNEVARFILSDLDKAIEFMTNSASVISNKNRLSKNVALLIKSRVALYEASWLRYHAGTARVPNGPNWPGAALHPNYQFPGGSLESEVDFFLKEAVSSSKELINIPLQSQGAGKANPDPTSTNPTGWNDYYQMFVDVDMSKYEEVLFWRQYSADKSILHPTTLYLRVGADMGLTRGLVNSYLMNDGKPIYASSEYKGDVVLDQIVENRDPRLQLFMLTDNTRDNITIPEIPGVSKESTFKDRESRFPDIIRIDTNGAHVTGFSLRKGINYDPLFNNTSGMEEFSGSLIFRVGEAYLNFLEASYMLTNSLSGEARAIWGKIRSRAGMSESSIDVTLQNTDMSKEAEGDWAAYSAGQLIDPVLYNIRRERRNELIGEASRWDDLYRWRALDQVRSFVPEGFNLWDENFKRYVSEDNKTLLIEPGTAGKTPNVSAKSESKYLRPYRVIKENNEVYDGYNFRHAKYLSPIPIRHIELASPTGSVTESNFYQNPGWPTVGNSPALKSSDPLDN